MNNSESNSINVARLLDRTAALAFDMDEEEIFFVFEEAEAKCISGVSSRKDELEIKRRVAEWKMKIFCDRDAPFEKVKQLYSDVCNLGYSNLEVEGVIEIYFAQYCMRNNNLHIARSLLKQLCSKLTDALRTDDLDVYHQLRKDAEIIIRRSTKKINR